MPTRCLHKEEGAGESTFFGNCTSIGAGRFMHSRKSEPGPGTALRKQWGNQLIPVNQPKRRVDLGSLKVGLLSYFYELRRIQSYLKRIWRV